MSKLGRPAGGKNKYWTKDEKLRIVKRISEEFNSTLYVSKDEHISNGMLNAWLKKYYESGEIGLENSKNPGNPLSKYSMRKVLNEKEQLEYEIMKLRIENERLKKGYLVKGGGKNKEYITLKKTNMQ